MSATDRIRECLKHASHAPWWFRDGATVAVLGEGDDGVECEVGTPLGCGDARADAYLIAELRNHAEALVDLADAARRVPDDGEVHGTTHDRFGHLICADCRSPWPCPTSAIRDAFARLDGEDGDG